MKLRELFLDESRWTRYAYARDDQNNRITKVPGSFCFCLLGGIDLLGLDATVLDKLSAAYYKRGIYHTNPRRAISKGNDVLGYDVMMEILTELDV